MLPRRALLAGRLAGLGATRDFHDGLPGGATKLDNLVLLCRRHHRAVHEEGFAVALRDDGEARFTWPDGRPLLAAPPAPRWKGRPLAPTTNHLADQGITIDATTATPNLHGDRLDLAYAIDVLWRPPPASA